jgi:hypothetical protein
MQQSIKVIYYGKKNATNHQSGMLKKWPPKGFIRKHIILFP